MALIGRVTQTSNDAIGSLYNDKNRLERGDGVDQFRFFKILTTYPSPKSTMTLASPLRKNVGLGEGWANKDTKISLTKK